MSAAPESKDRVPELDALRGTAALGVMLFHYFDQYELLYDHVGSLPVSFDFGKYGVQLFFVISGFVIFWTLQRTRVASDFVLSRISRLFPAYLTCLAITLVVVAIFGLPGQQVSLRDAILNVTMFPALLGAKEVDGSYWTLQIELFFYVQMLFWFMVGGLRHIRWVIAGWLVLAAAYALAYKSGRPLSYTAGELLDVNYIPYFAAGIIMYLSRGRDSRSSVDWLLLGAAVGVTGLKWGWKDAVVLSVCIAIFAILNRGYLRRIAVKPLIFLGTISYSLYLIHQQIGYIVIHWLEQAGVPALMDIALTAISMTVLAWLINVLIEQPAMRGMKRLIRDRGNAASLIHGRAVDSKPEG